MASTIVLAVFIASVTTFDAGVANDGSFQQTSLPNSDAGIQQLGQWLNETGAIEFDRICVSGPPIGVTPVFRFWSTRKAPVFLMNFGQVEQYMKQHGISTASAEVVAKTCISLFASKSGGI